MARALGHMNLKNQFVPKLGHCGEEDFRVKAMVCTLAFKRGCAPNSAPRHRKVLMYCAVFADV